MTVVDTEDTDTEVGIGIAEDIDTEGYTDFVVFALILFLIVQLQPSSLEPQYY